MPPIWDDPWMLLVFISIATALAFFIYVIFFVARFGRRSTVVPSPGPGGPTGRVLKLAMVALVGMAIVVVFLVPATFTETVDEPYTGPVEKQKNLHYLRSATVADSAYYEYFVNLTGRYRNIIRGTIEETEGEPVDLYIFTEEEFDSWLQDGTVRPELSLENITKENVSFSLVPVVSRYYAVVRDIHPPASQGHYTLSLEHFWQERNANVTRRVTKQRRETLFRHWTG